MNKVFKRLQRRAINSTITRILRVPILSTELGWKCVGFLLLFNKHTTYPLWYLKIMFTLIKLAVRKDEYDEVMLVCP